MTCRVIVIDISIFRLVCLLELFFHVSASTIYPRSYPFFYSPCIRPYMLVSSRSRSLACVELARRIKKSIGSPYVYQSMCVVLSQPWRSIDFFFFLHARNLTNVESIVPRASLTAERLFNPERRIDVIYVAPATYLEDAISKVFASDAAKLRSSIAPSYRRDRFVDSSEEFSPREHRWLWLCCNYNLFVTRSENKLKICWISMTPGRTCTIIRGEIILNSVGFCTSDTNDPGFQDSIVCRGFQTTLPARRLLKHAIVTDGELVVQRGRKLQLKREQTLFVVSVHARFAGAECLENSMGIRISAWYRRNWTRRDWLVVSSCSCVWIDAPWSICDNETSSKMIYTSRHFYVIFHSCCLRRARISPCLNITYEKYKNIKIKIILN